MVAGIHMRYDSNFLKIPDTPDLRRNAIHNLVDKFLKTGSVNDANRIFIYNLLQDGAEKPTTFYIPKK